MLNREKVFISYSTSDSPCAGQLKTHLEKAGFRCWKAPEDIQPGESWPAAITRALQESWVMILICSRQSLQSPEVSKELTLAMNGGVTVIPYRIENILPSGEWAYHLANIQWFDAFGGHSTESCNRLADHLHNQRTDHQRILPAPRTAPVIERAVREETLKAYLSGLMDSMGSLASLFTMLGLNLHAHPSRSGVMTLDMMVRARQAPAGFDLNGLKKSAGRKVVAGSPGSGKSTLMKMLALEAARDALAALETQIPIPVFLELGGYTAGSLSGLSLVRESLSRFAGRDYPEADVRSLLESREVLWVMDGMDEGMIGETRVNDTALWREIQALVSLYPGHTFVVSTRESHTPSGKGFETLSIKPLGPQECRAFIGKYLDYFQCSALPEEVYAAMPESLRKIATTPLMLSMVISIYLHCGSVPSTTQELYREFVSHTLCAVEADRSTRIDPYVKDTALAALAFHMLSCSRSSLRTAEANAVLDKRHNALAERSEAGPPADPSALLEELIYSGLLVRRDHHVAFLHMTLLEYFAQCEMSREYHFTASVQMDQHFLRNPDKIACILKAAAITPQDHVIEVGAGIGSVAKHFPPSQSLHLVDLDPGLARILRHQFPGTPILERDALEVLRELPCDVLVSNLPFFLTPGVLEILATGTFQRAVLSVHADDDFTPYEGTLSIQFLCTLEEQDFFPRQPFQSKLILVTPRSGAEL